MSVDEFSKRSNAGEHLLFFASLRRQELSALAGDLPSVAAYSKLAARGEVNAHVWMGSAGATSTLHYDTAHNSYLQLYGRKRFLLLPPSYTAGMPTYPEAHPSNRQARPPPLLRGPVTDVVVDGRRLTAAILEDGTHVPFERLRRIADQGHAIFD